MAHVLGAKGRPVRPVIAAERRPSDASWIEQGDAAGVTLVWPAKFSTVFAGTVAAYVALRSPRIRRVPDIDVACDTAATPAELAAVEAAFDRAGFEVHATRAVEARSGDLLHWVIYVTLGFPITAFFSSFGSEAGKDAYPKVKRWVTDIWAARNGTGSMRLQDSDHTDLVLSSQLPDEALDALREID